MGVAATLTVSLVVGGQLWGMIACHRGKPWFGPFALRQDCQFLGQVTAAQIGTLAATAVQTCRCKRTEMLAKLLEQIAAVGDFRAGLTKGHPTLMDFVESTGVAGIFDDVCLSVGAVPSDTILFNLREWLIAHSAEPLFAAHTLPLLYPPGSGWMSIASGLLRGANPSSLAMKEACVRAVRRSRHSGRPR
jgi:light-regulated signal transduction histidine kinase (bacteriophytochrome)